MGEKLKRIRRYYKGRVDPDERGRVDRLEFSINLDPDEYQRAARAQWWRTTMMEIETGDWVTFTDGKNETRRRVWGRITGQEADANLLNFNAV